MISSGKGEIKVFAIRGVIAEAMRCEWNSEELNETAGVEWISWSDAFSVKRKKTEF